MAPSPCGLWTPLSTYPRGLWMPHFVGILRPTPSQEKTRKTSANALRRTDRIRRGNGKLREHVNYKERKINQKIVLSMFELNGGDCTVCEMKTSEGSKKS